MPSGGELEALIKVYLKARERLLEQFEKTKGKVVKAYIRSMMGQINKLLKQLSKKTSEVLHNVIPTIYQQAAEETYELERKGDEAAKPPEAFSTIHTDAVYEIVREAETQIDKGLAESGKQMMQVFKSSNNPTLKRIIDDATAEKTATMGTVKQMQKDLIESLKENGILEIKYGKGKHQRTVPLEVYAAMVARTATREAYNVATLNQLIANGFDLVEMDFHTPTCATCATYQGRVYSISGNDKRFPPLSRAFHNGYHNIHPNCQHTIGAWIESMHSPDEIAAAIKRSNEPFTDNRSDSDREYYNRLQRQGQQARQNQYQYERYKKRLGDDAPKSVGAFNRLKKAGGKKWEELQEQYRVAGVDKTKKESIISAYKGSVAVSLPSDIPQDTVLQIKSAADQIASDFKGLDKNIDKITFGVLNEELAVNVYDPATGKNVITLSSSDFANQQGLLGKLADDYNNGLSYRTETAESLVAHEMGHAAHNALALKRAGVEYGKPLTPIELELFNIERNKISQEIYFVAFSDESQDEIMAACTNELGTKSLTPTELIAQSFGNYYYGTDKSNIANSIVNYFKKELR